MKLTDKIEARIKELEKQLESTTNWDNFQEKEAKYAKCDRLKAAIEELKTLLTSN
jgi:cell fate (sporulation/competence/biofilm development) regulator YmcA (YheA/YmcA/DUF963 family)